MRVWRIGAIFGSILLMCASASAEPVRERLAALARETATMDPEHPLSKSPAPEIAALAPGTALPPPIAEQLKAAGAKPDLESALQLAGAIEDWNMWGESAGQPRSILFARPEPARRAAARLAARAIIALCAGGAAVIDRAVEDADRAAAAARGKAAPGVEDDVERVLHARQVVLPLRAARWALVLAASETDKPSCVHLAELAGAIAHEVEPVSAWAETERAMIEGLALALAGKGASALSFFETARSVSGAKDVAPALHHGAGVEAALGEALVLGQSRGPITARESLRTKLAAAPFTMSNRRDLGAWVAAADIMLRFAPMEAASLSDEEARRGVYARAIGVYQELLPGATPDERAALYAHLALQGLPQMDVQSLPPVAAMARASEQASAPDSRGEAVATLEGLLMRSEIERTPIQADATFLLVNLGLESRDLVRLQRTSELASGFSEAFAHDPRAPEALILAARAADRLVRASTDMEAAQPAAAMYLAALRRIHTSPLEVPERDAWRLALGKYLAGRAGAGEPQAAVDAGAEASLVLGAVADEHVARAAAVELLRVWRTVLRAARDAPVPAGGQPLTSRVAMRLLELSQSSLPRASEGSAENSEHDAEEQLVARAEALNALARPADALTELERLLAPDVAAASPSGAAALASAMEAMLALRREADARTLAERLDGLRPGASSNVLRRLSDRAWREVEPLTHEFFSARQTLETPAPIFLVASERSASPSSDASMQRTRLAWALFLAGDIEAAQREFAALGAGPARNTSILRGGGEAALLGADDERAFDAFRAAAQALEAEQDYSRDYFHAWARMLEILARRPRTPDDIASLRREITRLRSLPASERHAEAMTRLKRVEETIAK